MNLKNFSNIDNKHAVLAPSKPYWIFYDDERLIRHYNTYDAAQKGTIIHRIAKDCIDFGLRLDSDSDALNKYVSDSIDDNMETEKSLYYNHYCYGTADAIGFSDRTLRVYDLKTGKRKGQIHQLYIYAALFCLTEWIHPDDISIVLRMYQDGVSDLGYTEVIPDPSDISNIMDTIIRFCKILEVEESK